MTWIITTKIKLEILKLSVMKKEIKRSIELTNVQNMLPGSESPVNLLSESHNGLTKKRPNSLPSPQKSQAETSQKKLIGKFLLGSGNRGFLLQTHQWSWELGRIRGAGRGKRGDEGEERK